MPPNQPGQPDNGTPQDGGSSYGAGANPYYGQQGGAAAAPDLDANAPMLKSTDVQRLNRKALLFLGGIVLLLLVVAFFLLKSATSSDDKPKKVDEEVISVPDAPVNNQAPPPLPPLPPEPVPVAPIPMAQEPQRQSPRDDQSQGEQRDRGPSLVERRMLGEGGGGEQGGSGGGQGMTPSQQYLAMVAAQQGGGAQQPAKLDKEVTSAQPLYNPDTLLLRGTYIRCVMETRIVTDVPGFSSCIVTEPIYSVNGRRLLLPKGSKVSGRYQNGNTDSKRVAVVWDRITTPTGLDVNMASPGIDNLGGAGIPGQYDAHWGSRIASALLISLISDAFKYAAAENGPESTTVTQGGTTITQPYESNTAKAMERLANQALDKSVNRPATITVNQGSIVNIYVAKDVDFSPVLR
ncbi:TrbI/VirB10 family protein [Lysobacter enzymogenes]|uniref:TrbI/VirB10 family protein n=1 Tax=Lysobacter enzymogenes TaxID=69 RepID=UPI00384BBB4A